MKPSHPDHTIDGVEQAVPDMFAGTGEMRALARALDWSATPLGASAAWPPELRAAVRLLMGTPIAASLWCGPEYTLIYNDAYARILNAKHPDALGRSGAEVWDELWPVLAAQFEGVRAGGSPVFEEKTLFRMQRLAGGETEEAWFTYSLSALASEAGECLAVYNVAVELTDKVRESEAIQAAQFELEAANTQLLEQRLALEERTQQAETERARATDILEAMTDAYFVLDASFRFVSVNAACERALFHTSDQLLGRTLWDAFPGTVGTIFERSYRQVATERVPVHFTGEYGDGVLDIVPEVDAYPAPGGGVAVFWRDVAPRRRTEAALRASEQRLRDVFEQAPVAVAVMTGPDHVYTAVSPMYARTPGLGRPLLGLSMRDAFPEIAGMGYIEVLDRVYHTGEPFAATERLIPLARADDGVFEDRYYNVGYQPLRDPAGKVYAVASVAYDVTDQVRARHEVEKARTEAESANAAKSEFLSTMSHELRTPLNAISGYTDLLLMEIRGTLTVNQRTDLERIRRANQHLTGLVTDVLNFARLDAGHVEFNLTEMEVAPVIADLLPLISPQLMARALTYDDRNCIAGASNHRMRADSEKVRQILLNLLTNAVKFTDAGGRVTIGCEADPDAGMMRIRVSDTGRGIPAEQVERIFEPFVQIDRHRTQDSQQGVGLGLAISRDLARGMAGDLAAASVPGEGSTFTLQLPLAGKRAP